MGAMSLRLISLPRLRPWTTTLIMKKSTIIPARVRVGVRVRVTVRVRVGWGEGEKASGMPLVMRGAALRYQSRLKALPVSRT